MNTQNIEMQQAAKEIARWWWAWLVTGIVWIIAGIVILRFTSASVVTVGVIIGVLFLVSGIESFMVARFAGGWAWLYIVFGVILVLGGLMALFNPVAAFLAIADILGFVLVLTGVFWIVEALSTQEQNPLWGLGLVAGIIMIGLGFATAAHFLPAKAYMLLVLAGIWTLVHGIMDIVKAFQIKHLGEVAATNPDSITGSTMASTPTQPAA
jgi:uncharacterized membrane protein HdeD (DUF308 family)